MSKKRLGISSFDIPIKFNNEEEAFKYAKRLIEFIRYICNKKEKDGWAAEAIVCISNIKGNSCLVRYERNGNKGRPKKVKEFYDSEINVDWHIHLLLVSKPMYSFRDEIKNYIDKNWIINIDKNVYKKDTNIKKVEYIIDQAEKILFYNCKDKNIIPIGYGLKDLYKAYMRMMTARKYNAIKDYEKRLRLEKEYNDILDFYWNLSIKEDKRNSKKFIEKVKRDKIAIEYERLNNNKSIKVQKDTSLSTGRRLNNIRYY